MIIFFQAPIQESDFQIATKANQPRVLLLADEIHQDHVKTEIEPENDPTLETSPHSSISTITSVKVEPPEDETPQDAGDEAAEGMIN